MLAGKVIINQEDTFKCLYLRGNPLFSRKQKPGHYGGNSSRSRGLRKLLHYTYRTHLYFKMTQTYSASQMILMMSTMTVQWKMNLPVKRRSCLLEGRDLGPEGRGQRAEVCIDSTEGYTDRT